MQVLIGQVTHYYSHLGVAVVTLHGELDLWDTLIFLGHTTDHTQIACSLESGHHILTRAQPGEIVTIKVDEPVHVGDQVFRLQEGAGDPQNQLLWKGMMIALHNIYHTYQPVFAEFEQSSGLAENIIGLLFAAITMEPNSVSPERLRLRGPYTAPQTYMARLHAAEGKGFLLDPEPGEFRLTLQGHQTMHKLIDAGRAAMQRSDPLPPHDSQRLGEPPGPPGAGLFVYFAPAGYLEHPPELPTHARRRAAAAPYRAGAILSFGLSGRLSPGGLAAGWSRPRPL